MKRFSKKLILFVLVTGLLSSCRYATIPKYFRKQFNTFSPNNFSVDTNLIHLNKGFYIVEKAFYKPTDPKLKDSLRTNGNIVSKSNYMFFKNGFCYRRSLTNPDYGTYKLCRDTIKLKVLNRSSMVSASVDAEEEWYKIIDKNTLKLIYFNDIDWKYYYPSSIKQNIDSVRSVQSKFQLNEDFNANVYDNWLINKMWFWKYKEEYKQWKRKAKTK